MVTNKKKSTLLLFIIKSIFISFAVAQVLKFFIPYYRIVSDSMVPTYNKGTFIVTSKFYYNKNEIKKNDIVVFKPNKDTFNKGFWTHRIIAIAGDKVVIKNGLVSVNGSPALYPLLNGVNDFEYTVPEGHVFQKGDNKNTIFGPVPINDIHSKVIFGIG